MNTKIYKINKINEENAYLLGFIAADASITKTNYVDLKIEYNDRCILEYISNFVKCEIKDNLKTDKTKRIFPNSRCLFSFDKISMYLSGQMKKDRTLPQVPEYLNKNLLQGFFDGDGCITWGYRKDRNRLWQKISFTSSYKLLYSVQKLLTKYNITTSIHPKTEEDCFVLEFSNEVDILKFFKIIYKSEFKLERKYINFINWIKAILNKYKFNINDKVTFVDKRTLNKYNIDYSNYILHKNTFKIIDLYPNNFCKLDNNEVIPINLLSKAGISNYALRLELDEFGETLLKIIPSLALDHSNEGVETTGEKMVSLNNQLERPSL